MTVYYRIATKAGLSHYKKKLMIVMSLKSAIQGSQNNASKTLRKTLDKMSLVTILNYSVRTT